MKVLLCAHSLRTSRSSLAKVSPVRPMAWLKGYQPGLHPAVMLPSVRILNCTWGSRASYVFVDGAPFLLSFACTSLVQTAPSEGSPWPTTVEMKSSSAGASAWNMRSMRSRLLSAISSAPLQVHTAWLFKLSPCRPTPGQIHVATAQFAGDGWFDRIGRARNL